MIAVADRILCVPLPRDEYSSGGIVLPEWNTRTHGEPLRARVISVGPQVPGDEIRAGMVIWLDPNAVEDDRFSVDGVEYVSPRFSLFSWKDDAGALFGVCEESE